MHPEIFLIIDMLRELKLKYSKMIVELCTNGYGEDKQKIIKKLPTWLMISNSSKKSRKNRFKAVNIAPIDVDLIRSRDFSFGCFVSEMAGISLNRYGYYPCGVGGAIDRVFGFDIGIKNLKEALKIDYREKYQILCQYCGYFKRGKDDRVAEQNTSLTWLNAIEEYHRKNPVLTLY